MVERPRRRGRLEVCDPARTLDGAGQGRTVFGLEGEVIPGARTLPERRQRRMASVAGGRVVVDL